MSRKSSLSDPQIIAFWLSGVIVSACNVQVFNKFSDDRGDLIECR